MSLRLPLLPTTLVGSLPQPEWLIDRQKLGSRLPPRVRLTELWRVAPEWLEQAQDDATMLAIRAQERAGLDILTDGEMRRESYSNRFATALEGVDIDNPGRRSAARESWISSRESSERSAESTPWKCATSSSCERTPTARSRSPCPGRSRWRSRRRTITTGPSEEDAGAGLRGGGERGDQGPFRGGRGFRADRRALHAGAAGKGAAVRDSGAESRARRRHRHDDRALCFGYAAIVHERPRGYSFLPELAESQRAADFDRDGAIIARLLHPRRSCRERRSSSARSTSRPTTLRAPETVAARIRRALPFVDPDPDHRGAGLRDEVSAARSRRSGR